jgi:hypothetical protein
LHSAVHPYADHHRFNTRISLVRGLANRVWPVQPRTSHFEDRIFEAQAPIPTSGGFIGREVALQDLTIIFLSITDHEGTLGETDRGHDEVRTDIRHEMCAMRSIMSFSGRTDFVRRWKGVRTQTGTYETSRCCFNFAAVGRAAGGQ